MRCGSTLHGTDVSEKSNNSVYLRIYRKRRMKHRYIVALLLLTLASCLQAFAQVEAPEIDYNRPRKYIVGGVTVEGNNYFNSQQIIQLAGLAKGMEITVPGEEVSAIVR